MEQFTTVQVWNFHKFYELDHVVVVKSRVDHHI